MREMASTGTVTRRWRGATYALLRLRLGVGDILQLRWGRNPIKSLRWLSRDIGRSYGMLLTTAQPAGSWGRTLVQLCKMLRSIRHVHA